MSFIKAISTYFPDNIITNDDIVLRFPEWSSQKILNKIGVKQRYVTHENQFTSDIATKAVEKLLTEHNIEKSKIDFLILCTQTPDYLLPTTACIVQHLVGLPTTCASIDLNQGCSGYVYGLSVADGLIASGNFKNVVLVTADVYSKRIHSSDKGNISIFGDAATATLISNEGEYKIGKFTLGTDGSGAENIIIKNSGTRYKQTQNDDDLDNFLQMKGNKVFQFIMKYIPPVIHKNLEKNNLNLENVDLFVFHQANTHILSKLHQEIEIPSDKFVLEMENYGNTVSSTIPIALKAHLQKHPEKPNEVIQLAGFGVGYSWGATCIFKQ
ncbi:ketoacyl-ACP synthase III [Capnocytophaga canimorsus]|uniref:ketoacyl-ACP synthase III n=1 Tax=Capnocytophaga canimorsus TaxID=28188 RepID=UPI0037CD6D13